MLEGTPKYPLEGLVSHLTRVERNMRLRRKRLMEALADDEIAPTVRVKAPGADGPGREGRKEAGSLCFHFQRIILQSKSLMRCFACAKGLLLPFTIILPRESSGELFSKHARNKRNPVPAGGRDHWCAMQ